MLFINMEVSTNGIKKKSLKHLFLYRVKWLESAVVFIISLVELIDSLNFLHYFDGKLNHF